MSSSSEPDMMSKELQNSDSIYMNLMTDVFKIIVKYRRKVIAKYRHLSPSGNRALQKHHSNFSGVTLMFLLLSLNILYTFNSASRSMIKSRLCEKTGRTYLLLP